MINFVTSIPSAVSKSIGVGAEKLGKTGIDTINGVSSTLSSTLSGVTKPTFESVMSAITDVKKSFTKDVIDPTIKDITFDGFIKDPLKSTAKAVFSPIMVLPRAGLSVLKTSGSIAKNTIIGAPKRAGNTAGSVVSGTRDLTKIGAKTVVGVVGAGVGAAESFIDSLGGGVEPKK